MDLAPRRPSGNVQKTLCFVSITTEWLFMTIKWLIECSTLKCFIWILNHAGLLCSRKDDYYDANKLAVCFFFDRIQICIRRAWFNARLFVSAYSTIKTNMNWSLIRRRRSSPPRTIGFKPRVWSTRYSSSCLRKTKKKSLNNFSGRAEKTQVTVRCHPYEQSIVHATGTSLNDL